MVVQSLCWQSTAGQIPPTGQFPRHPSFDFPFFWMPSVESTLSSVVFPSLPDLDSLSISYVKEICCFPSLLPQFSGASYAFSSFVNSPLRIRHKIAHAEALSPIPGHLLGRACLSRRVWYCTAPPHFGFTLSSMDSILETPQRCPPRPPSLPTFSSYRCLPRSSYNFTPCLFSPRLPPRVDAAF